MSTPTSKECAPTQRLLADPEVVATICRALRAKGIRKKNVEDGLQEVYVRALRVFRVKPGPTELEHMKAFCARVAINYAFDQARKAKRRKEDLAALCDIEEYGGIDRESVARRDPVDARRQLEVLAELFREGRMPEHGIDILEGVAFKCSYRKIGEDIGLSPDVVEWRMREMRRIYRQRMAKLGILPGMKPLHVVLSNPSAISVLRRAA
jgi:DNA-directed RNA polymerase specialized sigma24 family protein